MKGGLKVKLKDISGYIGNLFNMVGEIEVQKIIGFIGGLAIIGTLYLVVKWLDSA